MGLLDDLQAAATRHETPCGDGTMVWHAWNEGAGPPIVLLHGGNGSWRHWCRNIGHLARHRHVLAADLPGLGESFLPPGVDDPTGVAVLTTASLRQLVPDTSGVDLVGFSFGAMVGGVVAAELGAALRSLTTLGAGALGVPRMPTALEKIRNKEGEARIEAHRANLRSLMIHDPAKIDDLALETQEWHTVRARYRSRGYAHTPLLKDALARTVCRLGVAWGEFDQVAYPHLDLRFGAVKEVRPDARTEVIPGAGHWVAYEAPEATNALLDRWLE
jgi:pimeloyl-ACP methyl ester carboxylesterase